TYGSRNNRTPRSIRTCKCGNLLSRKAIRCKDCYNRNRAATSTQRPSKPIIEWPTQETILEQLTIKSYTAYAKELGVSDNAIRKHLRAMGVTPPRRRRPRGTS